MWKKNKDEKIERKVKDELLMEETREVKERVYEDLQFCKVGTEEYSRMVDDFIKIKRLETEQKKADDDARMKEHQRKRDMWDIGLKHGLTFILGGASIGTTIMVIAQSMIFEETHTVTNPFIRMFMTKNLFKLPKQN